MDCHVTLPSGVMRTVSHLDVLRCGISNRRMSARGHERRLKRKSRTSAFSPIPDMALRRTFCDSGAAAAAS
jgi:hypothetical protein